MFVLLVRQQQICENICMDFLFNVIDSINKLINQLIYYEIKCYVQQV